MAAEALELPPTMYERGELLADDDAERDVLVAALLRERFGPQARYSGRRLEALR